MTTVASKAGGARVRRTLTLLLPGLIVACGCSDPRIRIYSYAGPGIRFDAPGQTYAWLPVQRRSARDVRDQYRAIHELFRERVEAELAGKGFTQMDEGKPDYWLNDHFGKRVTGNPNDPGRDLRYALLTIDVLDPQDGKRIWRSTAEVRVDPTKPPREIRALLQKAVQQMFAPVQKHKDG